jgi:hypothetical protein
VPQDRLWQRAIDEASSGNYARAVTSLEHYLEREPHMTDVERRLVFNQLSYFLVKDGRISEAQDYERRSHQIMTRSYLPDDLLQSARRAKEAHQPVAMRAAYARFLLQQRQLAPALRAHLAEAYLALGDSYRLEAERDAASGPAPQGAAAPGQPPADGAPAEAHR